MLSFLKIKIGSETKINLKKNKLKVPMMYRTSHKLDRFITMSVGKAKVRVSRTEVRNARDNVTVALLATLNLSCSDALLFFSLRALK